MFGMNASLLYQIVQIEDHVHVWSSITNVDMSSIDN